MNKALHCIAAALMLSVRALAQTTDVAVESLGTSALSVELSSDTIRATGATPGHTLVFFGIVHDTENYSGVIRREETAVTVDGSGAASWQPDGGMSSRSLWLAIDVRSGAVAVATPRELALRRVELAVEPVDRDGTADAVQTSFFYAEVVLVRPGTGVWTHAASRGGSRDLKTRPGALTVEPRAFRPIGGSHPPPGSLAPADLVVAIDPYSLAFSTVRREEER